jgi:hypothetical protein
MSMGLRTGIAVMLSVCWLSGCKVGGISKISGEGASTGRSNPGAFEKDMSPAMRNFRDQFIAIKTPEEVATLLDKLATDYDSYKDPDIQLIAAQLIPLRQYRGIVYRLRPLVTKTNALHSLIVTNLMTIATSTRVFVPQQAGDSGTMAWKSLNRYFAWPYEGMEKGPRPIMFETIQQFQQWQYGISLPMVNEAIGRINAIRIPSDKPIVWDNQIIFGGNTFGNDYDAHDRYVTMTEAERHLILAGFHTMRHNMLTFMAYNYDLLPELTKELGHLVGLDGFGMFRAVNGMSARDRAAVICPSRRGGAIGCQGNFASVMTLLPAGQKLMREAFDSLTAAVKEGRIAWDQLKKEGGSSSQDFRLINPVPFTAQPFARINETALVALENMIAGKPFRNAVTGEMVTINTPLFYSESPTDLKVFMPNDFDVQERYLNIAGYTDVRNYEYGMSMHWDAAAYGKYCPQVVRGNEVPKVIRNLSQSWGGWMANLPMTTLSMVF